MKKWTNRALLGLYIFGLLLIVITMVVVRLRLDSLVQITV